MRYLLKHSFFDMNFKSFKQYSKHPSALYILHILLQVIVMFCKIRVIIKMQSKAIERNVSLAVFVCSVNRDTKKELMTRLHLKILNHLCLYLPFAVAFLVSTFPSLSNSHQDVNDWLVSDRQLVNILPSFCRNEIQQKL